MAPPRTPKLLLAACSLFLAAACGVTAPENGAASLVGAESPAQGLAATNAEGELAFGAPHRFETGVTISVSSPKSFRPSASAYPQSPRAVAFGIEVDAGETTYRLSGLSVTAEVDGGGGAVKQVVDAVQGYNGIADAGKDLAPGRSVRLSLAFAVPDKPVLLRLQVRPSASDPVAATYCGKA